MDPRPWSWRELDEMARGLDQMEWLRFRQLGDLVHALWTDPKSRKQLPAVWFNPYTAVRKRTQAENARAMENFLEGMHAAHRSSRS